MPFLKIQSKPVGNATGQGPDVLAVSLASIDEATPATVEVKARAGRGPAEFLSSIGDNFESIDEDYLQSAWAAGVQLMGAHPDHRRAFALTAAQHLARLIDPERAHPPHEAHAVAVVDRDNLTAAKAKEHWRLLPPVGELHVIEVPELTDLRDELFEAAGHLTYGQLAAQAIELQDEAAGEFDRWRWMTMADLIEHAWIVRQPIYRRLAEDWSLLSDG